MTEFKHLTEIVKYGEVGYAGPSDCSQKNDEISILSDWNRWRNASSVPGARAVKGIFILDKPIAELHPDEFNSIQDLREFFQQHLFPNEKVDSPLITAALNHLNQGGLPTATYKSINADNMKDRNKTIMISEPNYKVNLIPTSHGLKVIEEDTYLNYSTMDGIKVDAASSKQQYLAKTTSEYLFTEQGDVMLMDCNVLCNNQEMAAACFDKASLQDRMFSFFAPAKEESVEAKELYQNPKPIARSGREEGLDDSGDESSLNSGYSSDGRK